VLREAGSGTRETLVRALALAGTELGPSRLDLASTAAVKAAAAEVATGHLVVVPVTGLDLGRNLRAVWLPTRRPEGPATDLVRLAKGYSSRSPSSSSPSRI
jgi:hypothetical protein